MANLCLNTQSDDPQLLNASYLEDQPLEDQTPEEVMPRPWLSDLPDCQPKITHQSYDDITTEDREILVKFNKFSQGLSIQLQRSITFQSKVREVREGTELCIQQDGSEDFWSFFSVWPILKLAREISGRGHAVQAIPLTTATVGPSSLLPQWTGTTVSRKVDFGLVIELNDDVTQQIKNLSDQENSGCGIGPASTVTILRTRPLFCYIEVKQQNQVVDPIVQLGVWTSAVYARWEQVKKLLGSSRDFPVSFGWTVEGRYWLLHLMRRLPDGSRRITENHRLYDTRNVLDIYLIITTLYCIIEYGYTDFGEQFLDSVLNIQA